MYKIYGDMLSGNCYKVKLILGFLDIDHEWIHVDILADETLTPEFREMNPNAKIPVLELGDRDYLWESNAILGYLADGTRYLPSGRYERSKVLQWQFFEQYSHEPYIATARFINKYLGLPREREAEYHAKQEGGRKALAVMDAHLQRHLFFLGDEPSIADISLYAYTHVADEGGFSLEDYPDIRRWLIDFEAIPGYVPMDAEAA